MPRRIMLEDSSGSPTLLLETPADGEEQLQELINANPDLLPVDDLAMSGPLAVIGRETTLSSGAVDLVALSRAGDLLVIEFKTGPQNADFRAALAQLVDYGSDLWGQSFETFERLVPLRYFQSDRCHDPSLKSTRSLRLALGHTWPDLTDEEFSALVDNLKVQISRGTLHYLLLAQRFTAPILRTIEYLNEVAKPRFYAIEVVRFAGGGLEAFESRVVQRPRGGPGTPGAPPLSELEFFSQFEGALHEEATRNLLQEVQALGFTVFQGTIGVSIRVPVPDRAEPLSVAWLNPPGRSGWLGLTDLTLGYDSRTTAKLPIATPAIERFFTLATDRLGIAAESSGRVRLIRLNPAAMVDHEQTVIELLRGVRDELQGT